jgi:hypothetical protein
VLDDFEGSQVPATDTVWERLKRWARLTRKAGAPRPVPRFSRRSPLMLRVEAPPDGRTTCLEIAHHVAELAANQGLAVVVKINGCDMYASPGMAGELVHYWWLWDCEKQAQIECDFRLAAATRAAVSASDEGAAIDG